MVRKILAVVVAVFGFLTSKATSPVERKTRRRLGFEELENRMAPAVFVGTLPIPLHAALPGQLTVINQQVLLVTNPVDLLVGTTYATNASGVGVLEEYVPAFGRFVPLMSAHTGAGLLSIPMPAGLQVAKGWTVLKTDFIPDTTQGTQDQDLYFVHLGMQAQNLRRQPVMTVPFGNPRSDLILPHAPRDTGVITLQVPSSVQAGQHAEFRVTLKNTGDATWTKRDNTLQASWDSLPLSRSIPFGLPHDVAPGESVQVNVEIEAPFLPGDYETNVELQGFHGRGVAFSEYVPVSVAPLLANLSVSLSGPASVVAGDPANYTIVVHNVGPDIARSLTVHVPQPIGFSNTSQFHRDVSGLSSYIGDILAGQTVSVPLHLTVVQGTPESIEMWASVSSTDKSLLTMSNILITSVTANTFVIRNASIDRDFTEVPTGVVAGGQFVVNSARGPRSLTFQVYEQNVDIDPASFKMYQKSNSSIQSDHPVVQVMEYQRGGISIAVYDVTFTKDDQANWLSPETVVVLQFDVRNAQIVPAHTSFFQVSLVNNGIHYVSTLYQN